MQDHSSSSGLERKTSRRRFTKAAVLAPVAGALAATAISVPLLAQAQTPHTLALQQAQSAPGTWSLTSPLPAARYVHTATLLPNGKVLVAGGVDSSLNTVATADLYDPATGTWTQTGSLQTPRRFYTATLLSNGKVLVVGGNVIAMMQSPTSSVELYDPATGMWTPTSSLQTPRAQHTATLLPNGKVLVAGGVNDPNPKSPDLATAELYDPATGTWTSTGSMQAPRIDHTATLLPNGKVLITGGLASGGTTATAELYDPAIGTWTSTGSMQKARRYPTATLLNTGKVLVVGNSDSALAEADLYDPATGTWTLTGSLNTPRGIPTATLLTNGQVLVAGGADTSSELYDPASGTWTTSGSMSTARELHTATLLTNGQVLVVGGRVTGTTDGGTLVLASAELFTPPSPPPTPTPTPAPFRGGNYFGTGTGGGSHTLQMLIQQSGANLTGTISWDHSPFTALSGTFTTSTAFRLQANLPNGALLLNGHTTLTSGALSGSFSLSGSNGTTSGTWTAFLFG